MNRSISIAIVSGAPSKENTKRNFDYLVQMIETHKEASLISFGELFLMSDTEALDDDKMWETLEETLDDIRVLSKNKNIAIAVGHPHNADGLRFIRHSIFMPNGKVEIYDKVHLGKNEKHYFKAGKSINVFHYEGFTFGIQLCIDTHIPEMTLSQRLKGVEIILAPFNTPYSILKRISNWKKYIPARAYEYNVVVLCHNTGGGIFAVDGLGENLCENDEVRSIAIVKLSKDKSYNKKVDYLSYRRPEIY